MKSKIPSKDLFLTGGILDYSRFEGKMTLNHLIMCSSLRKKLF
nr:MAG TPA: hypothetical protein [Caudoviricetes sp.]